MALFHAQNCWLQVLSLCDNPTLLNKDEACALFRLDYIVELCLLWHYVELHKLSMNLTSKK